MTTAAEWFTQGVARQNAGDILGAMQCYSHALAGGVREVALYFNFGLCLQTQGRDAEAVAQFTQALALKPDFAEAHNNLGNLAMKQGQLDAAQRSYEQALVADPQLAQAAFNLGLVRQRRGQLSAAVESFQQTTALAPAWQAAWVSLIGLLSGLRRTEDWLGAIRGMQAGIAEENGFSVASGLAACRHLGDPARETEALARALAYEFKPEELASLGQVLGLVQYFDVSQADLLALYRRYDSLMASVHHSDIPLVLPRRSAGAVLRIGYISPDFRAHVMGRLMLEVLRHHDRGQVEVYVYSLAEAVHEDAVTAAFRGLCRKFVNVATLPAQAAARLIAEDDLDVLVDLGGHAGFSRPEILAYKPAAVQVTHLGYHGALGLSQVDYKLTDRVADVPENATGQIEALLFMDGCLFPWRHVEPAASHPYQRAALGLEGKRVFGAFVHVNKLSPRCLAAWRAILEQVEGAVLAFSPVNDAEQASYLRQTGAAGIPAERVVFIPYDRDETVARARHTLIDVVLDTFPYTGGDTTLAALDMGVPVVTLAGQRHAERIGYTLLQHLGVEVTVAFDEQAYVALACRLATDTAFNEATRAAIRAGLARSTLTDIAAHVRAFEAALAQAAHSKPRAQAILTAEALNAAFQQGVRAHQSGDTATAMAQYQRVLADQPEHVPAHYMLGMLHKAAGEVEQARAHLAAAVQQAPDHADAWAALGRMDAEAGQDEEAISAFRRVLAIRPQAMDMRNDLALALDRTGHRAEAVAVLQQALTGAPPTADTLFNFGVLLQKNGQTQQAADAYARAVALQPNHLDAQYNLGVALQALGHLPAASGCYAKVLELRPDDERAYQALGQVYLAGGKTDWWLQNFQRFERACQPGMRMALYGLETSVYLADNARTERYLSGLLQGKFPWSDERELLDGLSQLLFQVLYFDVESRDMLRLYQQYDALLRNAFPQLPAPPAQRRPGKWRIGYLSGDFRDHVMGKMMYQAISRHDTGQFEVYCYSTSQAKDAWTARYEACCHAFVPLNGVDEATAAAWIAEDDLDLLVDLSTHTEGAAPGILALKPARVQLTHVGSAGAVGCAAIDFKLTDAYADVSASQEYQLERFLPMQGCVYPYRHIEAATEAGMDRASLGIAEEAVTLGAFVTLLKLSPRCLSLWQTVLQRLPQAVLLFSPLSEEARPYYLARVKAAGIDPARVRFVPASRDEAVNQARYRLVDITLDPMPYGGANGTLESLDMGVPVVTLCGKRHGERSSYSILSNLGVTQTVAQSGLEYVDLVARLAEEPAFMRDVQDGIARGLASSALVDMDAYARHLEAAYLQAIQSDK